MDTHSWIMDKSTTESNKWNLYDTSVFICLVHSWLAEIMLLYLFRYEIMKNVMIQISSGIDESLATTVGPVCTNATNIITRYCNISVVNIHCSTWPVNLNWMA